MCMNWKIEYCEEFPKLVNRFGRILIKFLEVLSIYFLKKKKKKKRQDLAAGPRKRRQPGQSMAALLGLEDQRKFQEERQNAGKEPPNHRDPPLSFCQVLSQACHSASAEQNSTRLGEERPGWVKQNGAQTSQRSGNIYAMASQNTGSLDIIRPLRPFHHTRVPRVGDTLSQGPTNSDL